MSPKHGGKKGKRTKKAPANEETNRYLPFAEEGQVYAIATNMLGNRRLTVECDDGQERLAIIPGKFKGRRNWINKGDLILLNLRDFQDSKADVVYIYSAQDAKRLQRKGEFTHLFKETKKETRGFVIATETETNDIDVVFDDNDDPGSGNEELDIDDL